MRPAARWIWLAGLAWAVGASAQPWRGTASLEIEVTDRGKRPLAGAEIHLQFVDAEPKAGPPPVSTDSTGRAVVAGLAEGSWLLEVRYQGAKPYSAVLQVEAGRRAVVVAGPVRDAAAPPLNVKFLKTEGPAAPEPRRGRDRREAERERPEPAPAPPSPRPQPAPPPPVTPRPQPTPPAPAPVTPPTPAPAPVAPPAASSPPPAPVTPRPQPAPPAPAPVAPPAASSPPPAPVTPRPQPAPPAPAPATPTAPPAATPAPPAAPPPVPAAPPRLAGAPIRGAQAGTCPECKQGEWAVSAQQAAGPAASGTCGGEGEVRAALVRLAKEAAPSLAGHVGPLFDPTTGALTAAAGPQARASVEPILAPFLDPAAPCQLLAVVLPREARYKGYGYEASDADRGGSCVGGEECEIGACAWISHPIVERTESALFVFALFQNRSPDRERRARLTVYFSHPDLTWSPR
jgi:hypothetical protein